MNTYTLNEIQHGIEINFDGMPSAKTREALKANGYRWHTVKKVWYAKETPERLALAERLTGEGTKERATTSEAPAPKEDKDGEAWNAYRAAIAERYAEGSKMFDYCMKKVDSVALVSGFVCSIDRQNIETRFCFGESGYDYEEASEQAENARRSYAHFRRENLKNFDSWVQDLRSNDEFMPCFANYYGKELKPGALVSVQWLRKWEVIEAYGGSCFLDQVGGSVVEWRGVPHYILTDADREQLAKAYEKARARHSKRIEAYLKRYGLSKVHAWTYWAEA